MEPTVQVIKVSDEGSSSPFIARIFIRMLEFRDTLLFVNLSDRELMEARNKFGKKFTPLYKAAQATRDAAREVIATVNSHKINIASGRAVKIRDTQYDILETIDIPLGQAIDKLITQGIIAIKTGLQKLLSDTFGVNIGFVFQKPAQFNIGILQLRTMGENDFADYLIKTRESWLSDLLELRNQQEHLGWTLNNIEYALIGDTTIVIAFPNVLNYSVERFSRYTANRILLFIENTMVYAFQRISKDYPINIVEIYPESRDFRSPQRFRLAPKGLDPSLPWKISYRDDLNFI